MIAGVDEVGRGPLVGPVVVAAVILNPERRIEGLADSKTLSESKRRALYDEIIEKAEAYSVQSLSAAEVDRLNILQATFEGMRRSVLALPVQPTYVLIDGNKVPPGLAIPASAVVKGDQKKARFRRLLFWQKSPAMTGVWGIMSAIRRMDSIDTRVSHRSAFSNVARIWPNARASRQL